MRQIFSYTFDEIGVTIGVFITFKIEGGSFRPIFDFQLVPHNSMINDGIFET